MFRRLLFPVALMLSTAMLAGCSYTPARINPEPLIVIDDDRGGYHSRSRGGYLLPAGAGQEGPLLS